MAIIIAVPIFFIFCLNDVSFLIRLAKFGIFAIASYGVFLVYLFIENLVNGNFIKYDSELPMFSSDFAAITGALA